jgi:hypothetical protein
MLRVKILAIMSTEYMDMIGLNSPNKTNILTKSINHTHEARVNGRSRALDKLMRKEHSNRSDEDSKKNPTTAK